MSTTQTALSWQHCLQNEKQKPYFQTIHHNIQTQRARGETIYPANADLFNAFKYTPLDTLKVVIMGQDPYHGAGQAHGLCFSVPPGIAPPPSLKNIFKEIQQDLDIAPPSHGCLTDWAQQGVLLLNNVLSVKAGLPQSHHSLGWQQFTDVVIQQINQINQPLVFLLWGSQAQSKCQQLDNPQHLILKTTHPSPLSAHRGFLGCQHFSKTNQWLIQHGLSPINWSL